ncbi:histidine kinase [Ruminococcaceae bacterium OttesenSCG-928-D13]|nr:histidine kinase [Ruminococcaceae bacterium OttesenSCG-928-D13]
MRRLTLKTKLQFIIAALFCAVLLVWFLFFAYSRYTLMENTKQNAEQASGQVISVLEEQFLELERLSFLISQSELVVDFAAEDDFFAYHLKAGEVYGLLDGFQDRADFVEHLTIFSGSDTYYRFWGGMGNTAASKVYFAVSPTRQPHEVVITLEGMQYIGYTIGIYRGDEAIGTIVMLMEESKLRGLLSAYHANDALRISLVAAEQVITSSVPELTGLSKAEALRDTVFADSRKVGFTPFEILVTMDNTANRHTLGVFLLVALATAAVFLLLFLVFTRLLNRSFLAPMTQIMQGVEQLEDGSETALPRYPEENFDRLAEKINRMTLRLSERTKSLYEAKLAVKQAEISRQEAVIISLKKQISAHFTVNVLGVIKRLAELGKMRESAEMCDGLSYLLRYANAGDEFIGGLEEIFTLEQYVSIMQIRYQNRFRVVFEVDEQLGDIFIPRMLIQPLIENAISHGLQAMESGGLVRVRARLLGTRLCVIVEDNGVGIPAKQLDELRERLRDAEENTTILAGLEQVALVNIHRRVQSYYGPRSGLTISSMQNEGTQVTLVMDGVATA